MAVLILNPGPQQIDLPCQKGGKGKPRDVGDKSPAFAGNERSSIRAQKRVLSIVSSPVDPTVESNLQTLFAKGAQVNCQGDVFNNANANVLCSAEVTSEMVVGGLFWIVSLMLSEV